MECNINKAGYFLIALVWNIAIASMVLCLVAWPLDILGVIIESEAVRGYAYGAGIIGTISMFWFGLLAAILTNLVKCKKCNSRAMSLRCPFFFSLIECKCVKCGKANA